MIALLTAVFVASLVGSLHCAGMCGGIVTLCVSGRPQTGGRSVWTAHGLYNFGRLVTYSTLGAMSGGLGAAVDLGGNAMGWSRLAMILAGIAMVVIGVVASLRSFGLQLHCVKLPKILEAPFQRAMSSTRSLPLRWQPLVVGLLTGLLPCGWLYAFVISAAGTGSMWLGALTMAVFWAGTVPIMLGLGVGIQSLAGPLRRHVPRLTAVALVVVGLITIVGRLNVPAYATEVEAMVGDTPQDVSTLDAGQMPCCHGP